MDNLAHLAMAMAAVVALAMLPFKLESSEGAIHYSPKRVIHSWAIDEGL